MCVAPVAVAVLDVARALEKSNHLKTPKTPPTSLADQVAERNRQKEKDNVGKNNFYDPSNPR